MFVRIEYSQNDFDVVKLPSCKQLSIIQLQNDFFHGFLIKITIISISVMLRVKGFTVSMMLWLL